MIKSINKNNHIEYEKGITKYIIKLENLYLLFRNNYVVLIFQISSVMPLIFRNYYEIN